LYDAAELRLDELVARLGDTHHLARSTSGTARPVPPCHATRARSSNATSRGSSSTSKAGDTFQTVLSRRQDAPGAVDPLRLYRYLRR